MPIRVYLTLIGCQFVIVIALFTVHSGWWLMTTNLKFWFCNIFFEFKFLKIKQVSQDAVCCCNENFKKFIQTGKSHSDIIMTRLSCYDGCHAAFIIILYHGNDITNNDKLLSWKVCDIFMKMYMLWWYTVAIRTPGYRCPVIMIQS
jgi:hypothetical protein